MFLRGRDPSEDRLQQPPSDDENTDARGGDLQRDSAEDDRQRRATLRDRRQKHEQDHDEDVLEDQDRDRSPPDRTALFAAILQHLQHDRRRRQAEPRPDDEGALQIETEREGQRTERNGRKRDLHRGETDQVPARLPHAAKREMDADVEMGAEDSDVNADTGCTSTNSKIGQTAILSTLFHAVAGTATIIDDCTIDLTGFSFDGGGIDVRVYVGNDGAFHSASGGFAISNDLVGIAFFDNTLRLTLPAGRTLNDFNSLSIWCVLVGVSFGTAFFN